MRFRCVSIAKKMTCVRQTAAIWPVSVAALLAAATILAPYSTEAAGHPNQYPLQEIVAPNITSDRYWKHPGCHIVGHTRVISIPGCLKFELSTNACRGYCMSYTMPTDEDIGPLDSGSHLNATESPSPLNATLSSPVATGSTVQTAAESKGQRNQETGSREQKPKRSLKELMSLPEVQGTTELVPNSSGQLLLLPPDRSIADTDKRELVSVSQCCSMVETDDIIVNLRCGPEIKRFVFKSAKTCECFFCKHV